MRILNKNKVTHIEVKDLRKNNMFKYYLPEKKDKFLWFTIQTHKECFSSAKHHIKFAFNLSLESINKKHNYKIIDNILFNRPNVKIFIGKNEIYEKTFETIEMCLDYVKKEYPKVNYIIK